MNKNKTERMSIENDTIDKNEDQAMAILRSNRNSKKRVSKALYNLH